MRKILCLVFVAAVLTGGCSKHNPQSDASTTRQGTEDNPNGGGGRNTTSVPPAVLALFNSRYPDASSTEWKLLTNGDYKAEFYRGSTKWQAVFTASGTLVKEERY